MPSPPPAPEPVLPRLGISQRPVKGGGLGLHPPENSREGVRGGRVPTEGAWQWLPASVWEPLLRAMARPQEQGQPKGSSLTSASNRLPLHTQPAAELAKSQAFFQTFEKFKEPISLGSPAVETPGSEGPEDSGCPPSACTDRKSTRLNSSH